MTRATASAYPVCPDCGNLCGRLARLCHDCGAYLFEPDPDDRAIRRRLHSRFDSGHRNPLQSRPMHAEPVLEDAQPPREREDC